MISLFLSTTCKWLARSSESSAAADCVDQCSSWSVSPHESHHADVSAVTHTAGEAGCALQFYSCACLLWRCGAGTDHPQRSVCPCTLQGLLICRCDCACIEQHGSSLDSIRSTHKAPSPSIHHMLYSLLLLFTEGINCGLDFKKALKDSEDQQLVKFQGSPQVGATLSNALAGPTAWMLVQACMQSGMGCAYGMYSLCRRQTI